MTTYAELAAKIVAVEDHEVGTGVSEDEIVAAEQILGGVLAGGYRQFLKQFGLASRGNLEVYGLGPGGPEYLDLVKVTISGAAKWSRSCRAIWCRS